VIGQGRRHAANRAAQMFRQRAIHNLQRRARQLGLELTPRGSTPALAWLASGDLLLVGDFRLFFLVVRATEA
jgi:hypothetical protein